MARGWHWTALVLGVHIPLCPLHPRGQLDPTSSALLPPDRAPPVPDTHFYHCCLCPCALTGAGLTPAAPAAPGFAKVMMIPARERPHTGSVISQNVWHWLKTPWHRAGTLVAPGAGQGHPALPITPHPWLLACPHAWRGFGTLPLLPGFLCIL